ncbi:MAG: PAS domain S-box protein [Blastocatellia bacterium]|nr:PAS domain S-box protein [Blastocatellia bacterium]
MPQPIRILVVEDDHLDAEFLIRALKNAGFIPTWERVDAEEDFLEHLRDDLDIILSDYQLPQFSGIRALELLKASNLEIPFIIVSGAIGDDTAILAMKLGATDYLLKDRLARLGQAVSQALEQGQLRKERQLIANELKKAEARYRSIFENATEGIFQTTNQGQILIANPALARIFGFSSPQEMISTIKDLRSQLYVDPKKYIEFEELMESQGFVSRFEAQFYSKDKQLLWASINAKTVQDQNGEILCEGTVEDITELKQAEEALRQSQEQFLQAQKMEAIGRLAGGIAHDFNNLLTVINVNAEFVSLHISEKDTLSTNLQEILKSVERATMLTRQLLAFSRKEVIQPKIINLNNLVNDMGKMLQRVIGENIELKINLAQNLWNVKVGPSHMDQVIMNLAVNSKDAMPMGGNILIETANVILEKSMEEYNLSIKPGEYVLLSVSDTGSGMDETTKTRIFDPFFTTKEIGKGTGLGLSTVYGIVKQSNGCIKVASELNKGTKFLIFIPRELRESEVTEQIQKKILLLVVKRLFY